MRVRRARPEDAEGVVRVHRRAVQEHGSEDYSEPVLEAWSPPVDDERIDSQTERLGGDDGARHFVAVDDGEVLGFSAVDRESGEIVAVYVDPDAARRGLGEALLDYVEWSASQAGHEEVVLESSLNAVEFYRKQGFEVVEETTVEVDDGLEMEARRMVKELPGPGFT